MDDTEDTTTILSEHSTEIEHLENSSELDLETPKDNPKRPMTPTETRAAIKKAIADGDISRPQGQKLLRSLNLVPQRTHNKKTVTTAKRKARNKAQKKSRKANR